MVRFGCDASRFQVDHRVPPIADILPRGGYSRWCPRGSCVSGVARPSVHDGKTLGVLHRVWRIFVVGAQGIPIGCVGCQGAPPVAAWTRCVVVDIGHAMDRVHLQANFWTSPFPYWNMKELAPELHAHLRESNLVIFKVRSNYISNQAVAADTFRALM